MDNLKNYIRNWRGLFEKEKISLVQIWRAVKYFYPWLNSQNKEFWTGPVDERIPWMTFGAIHYICRNIKKNSKVFEYGSGGSTLFFLERGCIVTSVENDYDWYIKIKSLVVDNNNFEYIYKKCVSCDNVTIEDLSDYNKYYSSSGIKCKDYVETICEYDDFYFDLVVIDGRSRPACMKAAKKKVKPGGYIIVDNTERDYYHRGLIDIFGECEKFCFSGPVPYLKNFTETSIFRVPL